MFTVSSNWLEENSYEQHLQFLWGLVEILEQESGPWASEIRAHRLANDPIGLAGLSIDHQSGSAANILAARQCRALVEKWDGLRSEVDREFVAHKKFQETEASCKAVNEKFRESMRVGGKQIPHRVWRVLQNAKQEIHRCLGQLPEIAELKFAFGPGANTSVKAKASSARWKLESPLVCSTELLPTVSRWLSEFPHWVELRRCYPDPLKGVEVVVQEKLIKGPVRLTVSDIAFEGPYSYDLAKIRKYLQAKADEVAEEVYQKYAESTEYEVAKSDQKCMEEKWDDVSLYDLAAWEDKIDPADLSMSLLSRLEDHLDRVSVPVVISPGKLQFVPKNYKTYRSIIVEALINSMLQKGYGSEIRTRLGRVGQNLNDQTRNQRLAREGSITGRLATVDLSSASDTEAFELIDYLLTDIQGNYGWSSVLSSLRTAHVDYKGDTIHLQKWSSMGNGYTFELESLVFWALTMGVCRYVGAPTSQVSVYGDDIICPVEIREVFEEVFEWCGFTVNSEKSFWTGPFRESCGADYYEGFDVRPFYMKKTMSGQALFAMHNFFVLDCRKDLADYVLQFIPEDLRLWGPAGYGDGHLIGTYSLRVRKAWTQKGFEGGTFDTYALSKKKVQKTLQYGDALLPTYSIYATGPSHSFDGDVKASDHLVVRGHEGYLRTSIYTMARTIFPKPRQ
jgi:hypothetical protein